MRSILQSISGIFTGLLKNKMTVTALKLQNIVPGLQKQRAVDLAYLLNTVCPKYGINTRLRMAAFIAQCAHESKGFSTKTENLNYSVEGLQSTFSYYKKNPALAAQHGRTNTKAADQVAIANTAYADRNRSADKKLGNVNEGDGWKWRGTGFIQITGRTIIEKYARYVKQDMTNAVENMRTTDLWALESACWVFAIEKGLLDEADKQQFEKITRTINGGLTGHDDRLKYYNRALREL